MMQTILLDNTTANTGSLDASSVNNSGGYVRWDDTVDNVVNFTHYFVGTAGQAWVDAFEMYI